MARHASAGCGEVGVRALVHVAMAIATIQAQLADVKAMVVGNGLFRHVAGTGELGRKVIHRAPRDATANERESNQYLQGDGVGPLWKNIRHPDTLVGTFNRFGKRCPEPFAP